MTDAILGFDRQPVDVGDDAKAPGADSSSQGVSRLRVASQARGALWLACLEDAEQSFSLDDPELTQLVGALSAALSRA